MSLYLHFISVLFITFISVFLSDDEPLFNSLVYTHTLPYLLLLNQCINQIIVSIDTLVLVV